MINLEINADTYGEARLTVDAAGIAELCGKLPGDAVFTPWRDSQGMLSEFTLMGPPYAVVSQWRLNTAPQGSPSLLCVKEFRGIHGELYHSLSLVASEACQRELAADLSALQPGEECEWVFAQATCSRLPRSGGERALRALRAVLRACQFLREAQEEAKAMPPVRMRARRVADDGAEGALNASASSS